jgi:hypothetical protein
MMPIAPWPFSDPPNVAVFTSKQILAGLDWVHYASHDADDGAWQFHAKAGPADEDDATVAGLGTMLELDSSLGQIADLPLGWCAWREQRDAEWQSSPTDD